jgi:hypothetical protein
LFCFGGWRPGANRIIILKATNALDRPRPRIDDRTKKEGKETKDEDLPVCRKKRGAAGGDEEKKRIIKEHRNPTIYTTRKKRKHPSSKGPETQTGISRV